MIKILSVLTVGCTVFLSAAHSTHALLAFLATQAKVSSPAEEMQLLKKLKVNDIELVYREEGNGATVLFVHGFAGDWPTWEPLRPFISHKYHYVSLSRRYHYPNKWTDDGKNYSPAYFRYREQRLLSCLPKTTVVAVIPSAHHEWYVVNPKASAKAILNFLADQRQTKPVDQPPGQTDVGQ